MVIWLDAHLSPRLANWLRSEFSIQANALRDLGLREASDEEIWAHARQNHAIVMSKDSDFAARVQRLGPPPQVVWLTCGNTTEAELRLLLRRLFPDAVKLLEQGEPLVEIG